MEGFWVRGKEVINEWEIQLLVLLSFILQVFLFFTGSLRRRSTNALLRSTIWLAYLGADVVAIYALGSLSRHDDLITVGNNKLRTNHPLAFLWAPLLLIHLGGQDTVTAFAIEDNNLWLRHLLNMAVQVTLALYVFWKSTSWRSSVWLLVPGIFLFIAGIIKYGERTMALMNGDINNVRESSSSSEERKIPSKILADGYDGYICWVLRSSPRMHDLFAGRVIQFSRDNRRSGSLPDCQQVDHTMLFRLLDLELFIMYSDLYTKARLLRTWSGVVLRLISQVSMVAALVLFTVSRKVGYGTADIVITYILLIGGFLLEVCAVLTTFIASPWTWAWLEARGHHRLARMSRSLLSCGSLVGWKEQTRPLWSKTMGQYSLLSYMGCDDDATAKNLSQRVMSKISKLARCLGIGESRKLFWLSKLLDTKYQAVDDKIMACVVQEIGRIKNGGQRQRRHLRQFMKNAGTLLGLNFIYSIGMLQLITEAYLNEAPAASSTSRDDDGDLADICRKLSKYMAYLVAAHPASASLLQVTAGNPEESMEKLVEFFTMNNGTGGPPSKGEILRHVRNIVEEQWELNMTEWCQKTTLEELRDVWVRLLLYAAAKSRPAAHAAQLARGGELLTFVWLLMAHYNLGDCSLDNRFELTPRKPGDDVTIIYVIDDDNETSEKEIITRVQLQ